MAEISNSDHGPFQGLQPFAERDALYFAGRANDVQVIISALHGSKLTVFYGESGVGKTSVIRAGVLPELKESEPRIAALLFRDWQVPGFQVDLRKAIIASLHATINRLRGDRGEIAFDALEKAFCAAMRESKDSPPLTIEALYRDIPLDRFMSECCAAVNGRLFFIFDQFEEYFLNNPPGSPDAEFDSAFARAVNSPDVAASFLLSLREDALAKLDRLRGRIPRLFGNMLRLEHLDRASIEEAIRKPIAAYKSPDGRTVTIDKDLVETLVEQVREDRVSFTEEEKEASAYAATNPEELKYKGLFLQVVLGRLWNKASASSENDVRLTRQQLRDLAKGKRNDETETMFIVRTYFEDTMGRLLPAEKRLASRVLRFLVRPGGQKKSRSVAQLAEDAGLDSKDPKVTQTLTELVEKLANDDQEFKLLARVNTGRSVEYSLRHDVMGMAIVDWSNRERAKFAAARRRKEVALVAVAVIALFSVGWYLHRRADQETLNQKQRADREQAMRKQLQFEGENRRALKMMQAATRLFGLESNLKLDPEVGIIAAIDAVAICRQARIPVSPHYAFPLLMASALSKTSTRQLQEVDTRKLLTNLPAVASPDDQDVLMKVDDDVLLVRGGDNGTGLGVKAKIVALGFNDEGKRFGVETDNGQVFTASLADIQDRNPASPPLVAALGIKETGNGRPPWINTAPAGSPWEISYNKVVNEALKTCVSAITRSYSPEERVAIGITGHVLSDDIIKAYKSLASGMTNEAEDTLKTAFEGIGIVLDDTTVKRMVGGHLFNRATRETNVEIREKQFNEAATLDPRLQSQINAFKHGPDIKRLMDEGNRKMREDDESAARAAFQQALDLAKDPTFGTVEEQVQNVKRQLAAEEMQKGNTCVADGKNDKAAEAFARAIRLDPSLGTVEEQLRTAKQSFANALMQRGTEAAKSGKIQEAISMYEKAVVVDPNLAKVVDPATEWQKFAPSNTARP